MGGKSEFIDVRRTEQSTNEGIKHFYFISLGNSEFIDVWRPEQYAKEGGMYLGRSEFMAVPN